MFAAGAVDTMLSGVLKFDPKVPKQTKNEVVVKLMDSFHNPVLRQPSRLKLEITSRNNSGFLNWAFVDNRDGSYSGHYLAVEVGTYELCVLLDGNLLGSCPFIANVYSSKKRTDGKRTSFSSRILSIARMTTHRLFPGEYFPKAHDDKVLVWEDESVLFDALANDFFAGDNTSIIDFSQVIYRKSVPFLT